MRNWPLFVGLGLFVVVVVFSCVFDVRYSFVGSYNFGRVVLYPDRTVNYVEFEGFARHEWAHYYMDEVAPKGFLMVWKKAVGVCGLETEYAMSYKGKSVQLEEEWAECSRLGGCCVLKMKLVNDSLKG